MKLSVASDAWLSLQRSGMSKALLLLFALLLLVLLVYPEPVGRRNLCSRSNLSVRTLRDARRAGSTKNPVEVLRAASYIYIRSLSALVTSEDIENKLRRHPDFRRYDMMITRMEADADIILEVRRSILTKFVFTAIEPATLIVGSSGKLSSLGGTVDGKVASLFMKQVVAARQK